MSKNTRNRILLTAVAALLLVAVTVGGTMAWLAADTESVTNKFTPSNVGVSITETDADNDKDPMNNSYKMVPGSAIAKDPKVTVADGSEPSYLFVQITKSSNYDTYMDAYEVAEGWTQLTIDGKVEEGVYYRTATAGQSFPVLAGTEDNPDGEVTVKNSVTKKMMEELTEDNYPTLSFKAYVVQQANLDVAGAWNAITDPDVNSSTTTTPEGY